MDDPFDPPPHARHVITADGESFIWQVRADIVIEKASGVLTLPLVQSMSDFFEPVLVPGMKCKVFSDLERITQHTREAREHMNQFALEYLDCFEVVHFLLSSKFLALGLSSFKQDAGTEYVRFYADRASFLESYRKTVSEEGSA